MNWFSDSTGLYFYSAVFQANMALLGLVAIFAGYRLSQIARMIESTDRDLKDYLLDWFTPLGAKTYFRWEHIEELRASLRNWFLDLDPANAMRTKLAHNLVFNDDWYGGLAGRRHHLEELREKAAERASNPLRLIGLVVLISVICLPCAEGLHSAGWLAETAGLATVTVLDIWALFSVISYVLDVLDALGEEAAVPRWFRKVFREIMDQPKPRGQGADKFKQDTEKTTTEAAGG